MRFAAEEPGSPGGDTDVDESGKIRHQAEVGRPARSHHANPSSGIARAQPQVVACHPHCLRPGVGCRGSRLHRFSGHGLNCRIRPSHKAAVRRRWATASGTRLGSAYHLADAAPADVERQGLTAQAAGASEIISSCQPSVQRPGWRRNRSGKSDSQYERVRSRPNELLRAD